MNWLKDLKALLTKASVDRLNFRFSEGGVNNLFCLNSPWYDGWKNSKQSIRSQPRERVELVPSYTFK